MHMAVAVSDSYGEACIQLLLKNSSSTTDKRKQIQPLKPTKAKPITNL